MNGLTESLLSEYTPKLLITVYEGTTTAYSDKYYLEAHHVNERGQVCEGKPLKQETIDAMIDVFYSQSVERSKVNGIYPDNLLMYQQYEGANYKMIWYREPEQRYLLFHDTLHIKDGLANVPAMIYHVHNGYLSVYALNESGRPNCNTKLYSPPFHNVGNDGGVCLGSAQVNKPKELTYTNLIKYWEDMFWLSKFSHLAGAGNPTKSNLNTLWKKLIKDNSIKWSDLDELKEIPKTTLQSLLK